MQRVILHSLKLQGFGLCIDRTFRLSAGINTLISPNETGKSTMLSGMLALLFGLAEKADAESWSTARFRNWDHPRPFRGELLLQAAGAWHRIRRDFDSHEVDWQLASGAAGSATAASDLSASKDVPGEIANWRPHFHDEHNPAARGDAARRYRGLLRDLLGIDDLELFRLTFCLAHDIDERTDAEEALRTRGVPASVQQLMSGGGRVDDVLIELFDEFAEISMATAAAGLVRPGKKRLRNQGTPGRLEQATARADAARRELSEASVALDQLQGSHEKLEGIRLARENLVRERDDARLLIAAWEGWSAARAERRDRQKRVIELDKAIGQINTDGTGRAQVEMTLRAEFTEYSDPAFPFAERRQALEDLIGRENAREQIRHEMDVARKQREIQQRQLLEADAELATRFAPFIRNPHLCRDFQEWRRVAGEIEEAQAKDSDVEREIERSVEALRRIDRWAALDREASKQGGAARPVARLKHLGSAIPRLIQRADEARDLASEQETLRTRLQGPLRALATASEDARRDALAYHERLGLLRSEAEDAARKSRDATVRSHELTALTTSIADARRALESEIGIRAGESPNTFPSAWTLVQQAIADKLALLREEGELMRAAERFSGRKAAPARRIFLPAAGAFIIGAIGGFAGSLSFVADVPWRVVIGLVLGLLASIVAVAIALRRSRLPAGSDLQAALLRLRDAHAAREATDRMLGKLRDLDGRALESLHGRLAGHATSLERLAALHAAVGPDRDIEALTAAARESTARLEQFRARMAPFGDDPAKNVAEWMECDRRLQEIHARLTDLEAEIGTANWEETPIDSLPDLWTEMRVLAEIVSEEPREYRTGGEVVAALRHAPPAEWDTWEQEAARFEQAQTRLLQLRSRKEALDPRGESGRTRFTQLQERAAELSAACAPFTLQAKDEEVVWAAKEFERKRETREKAHTLSEKLTADLETLEKRHDEAEGHARRGHRDLGDLLEPTGGDLQRARERLRAAADLRERLRAAGETERQVLRSHGVEDVDGLQLKKQALNDETLAATRAIKNLETRFPLLREIADAPPEEIQRRHAGFLASADQIEKRIAELDTRRDELQRAAAEAHAEGRRAGNVAVLEREIGDLETERESLILERDALSLAFETVTEAQRVFGSSYRERLTERANAIFAQITNRADRQVWLDDHFRIAVRESGGHLCAPRQLSQGARDQLALAIRLAVAELLAAERRLPLLLDDPFLTFDPERLAAMRATLTRIASERQILLLSHRADFADWGRPIVVS